MEKRNVSAEQRRVFMRRRIVAGLIALALLAGLVWGVMAGVRSIKASRQAGAQASAAQSSAAAAGKSAAKSGKGEAKDKKSSVPTCTPSDLELALNAPEPSTTVGGYVDFTATMRHKGSRPCLVDGSNASRVLVITSGDQTIWRSDSCPADSRLLLMAQGDHDDQPLRWNADATGDQCQPDENLPRVKQGTYKAQLVLKSNDKISSQPVPLIVQ
ncbi:hypothetical protein BACT_0359 [Bifidobacterium actinocoloniiforme DSM 22766]|uniref:Uncharacterized protein n=1 Tax=Bifidobacterium actinocoloniiforme DSM 22766 TaxID=1437605 RepID=A0A086YZF9_9BIFI|nr:hypothetical protein [Bifidobacterium actinocoloniiforme]KFI39659.1 hypothetical protein BACT_0359 [Bifidobacterium actinocoloniiforme DSM 22766]